MNSDSHDVTRLLAGFAAGRAEAGDQLAEVTDESLKRIALRQLGNRRGTLQPTLLVHEAYLSLFSGNQLTTKSRTEFYRLSAKVMRDLLVDQTRARSREKRGGRQQRVTLCEVTAVDAGLDVDALDLCDAMDELARRDKRQHTVVELRYFAGLTMPEIGKALELSVATVERDWRAARAWLMVRLQDALS